MNWWACTGHRPCTRRTPPPDRRSRHHNWFRSADCRAPCRRERRSCTGSFRCDKASSGSDRPFRQHRPDRSHRDRRSPIRTPSRSPATCPCPGRRTPPHRHPRRSFAPRDRGSADHTKLRRHTRPQVARPPPSCHPHRHRHEHPARRGRYQNQVRYQMKARPEHRRRARGQFQTYQRPRLRAHTWAASNTRRPQPRERPSEPQSSTTSFP
jgi:hypothetical protein